MKAKTKLTKLWSFLLSLVMLLSMLPTTAFAAGSAETTDITEIKLTGNYQYGTVPAGVLPAFNPGTTTEGIRMGTNAGWSYFINETSVWSGFGLETPTAVNDGKTKYGYRFQVKTNDGYQLASDLKVVYNDEDVTSTVEVTRWAWGAYVTVDLGKATVESPATYDLTTSVNGGHGTISAGENGITEGTSKIITFTPDSGYEIDTVTVNGTATSVSGNTLNVTMNENKTVVVTYKAIEYNITVTDGKATVGAGTPITKATMGTTVTLTANAAPTDMVFDKWEVISGSITLADANSATTTFTMPAGAVSVKATYTTYITVNLAAGEGSGTMEPIIIKNTYGYFSLTAPECTFTAPANKVFDKWQFSKDDSYLKPGDTKTIWSSADGATLTAIWKDAPVTEYDITVTDGKATVGAGTEITKAAEGTTVTLTANAAPTDMVFDKWEVISGSITLADANSATTTFTMPAGAVSVKATYTTYITVNLAAGEGSGTMEPIIIKNTYGYFSLTAPECTFTAPANKVFDKWQFSKDDSYLKPGDTKTIWSSADGATLTAIWKDAPVTEYDITVTDGKATVGAGTEITKAAEGTTVTLTANAAPTDKVFDKWEVISGSIILADANSATTTFTMPASAVSVKATYKNAPHTHTYNQETVKPEALKTPADCTHNAVYFKSCSCGAISTTDAFVAMNTALGHAYGSDWKYDSTNHWHECSRCHDKKYEAAHDYGSDNICDTCGYAKTVPHTHNLTLVAAKAATCTEGGKEAYYKCEGCGKFYEDVLGTKEITDLASWGNIAKIAHTTKQTVTKATPTANGTIVNYCSVCKKTLSTTVIPKASSIKLKATSLTYNGKVRTPKVIVKDRTGKTLVKNTDYTVSYAKGRKYVGKYAVKITFKGKYSGTKTLYFTIKPKATRISSLTAGSKKFTVKWKKQATQTTGYQVQYSASSKFSKAKTVTVGKNTTVSKKISKLSGKKKYYVRVRTYKTVKINGKSIRIYSGWSKAKTVTTKK